MISEEYRIGEKSMYNRMDLIEGCFHVFCDLIACLNDRRGSTYAELSASYRANRRGVLHVD